LQKEGGKCIIVENNQPTYIVMKLKDYQGKNRSVEETEKVNQDIDQWRAEKENEETDADQSNSENEKVKVEDLPF